MLPIEYCVARLKDSWLSYFTPGTLGKNDSLIVHPHGGPHGIRDEWLYNDRVQFLANSSAMQFYKLIIGARLVMVTNSQKIFQTMGPRDAR